MYRAGATADHLKLFVEEDVVDERFGALRVTRIIPVGIVDKGPQWCRNVCDRIQLDKISKATGATLGEPEVFGVY